MAITRIKKTSSLRRLKGVKGKHHACRSPFVHHKKTGACVSKSMAGTRRKSRKSRRKSRKSRR